MSSGLDIELNETDLSADDMNQLGKFACWRFKPSFWLGQSLQIPIWPGQTGRLRAPPDEDSMKTVQQTIR